MKRRGLESLLAVAIAVAVVGAGVHAYVMFVDGLPR